VTTAPERYNSNFATEGEAALGWAILQLCLGRKPTAEGWLRASGAPRPIQRTNTWTGRDSYFQRIKAAIRLEDFAAQFTELRLSGAGKLRGRCPLHDDRTPSFFIFMDKQRWRCFGCQAGGDLFDLARELERKGVALARKVWSY
jgi:hypothetical protein